MRKTQMKLEELKAFNESSRFRHFDWDKAKTFYYVSKTGSFTNAARFLNMSQPALSRQISSLEKTIGYPLFIRQSRGVTVTRKGEQLASIVEDTLWQIKQFTNENYVKTNNGKQRKIKMASTHALSAYILGDVIIDYNKHNPHLTFELLGDDHLVDVFLNDVDIAIRPIDEQIKNIPNQKNIRQEYLFSLEKKLYASPEYLEKYGEPQTVKDLKKHRLLAHANPKEHPYSNVNWILTLGMEDGELHEPHFISNSVECLIDAAKNGLGIVGSYDEMKILRIANLKNILPDVKCTSLKEFIIYPTYLEKDPEIKKLINYLKEKFTK